MASIKNTGVFYQIWIYEIFADILLICHIATMRVCGAWINMYIKFYVQKHIAHLVALFWFPAGSRRPARGARISETPLFTLPHLSLWRHE